MPNGLEMVPGEVRAALESAGASFASDPRTGVVHIGLHGFALARVDIEPLAFAWDDAALGAALRWLLDYETLSQALQANRGPATIQLRGWLRDNLGIDPLLDRAREAKWSVRRRGSLASKAIYFSHPAFGEFAQVTVLRGQSHVVDVAFSSPSVYTPLRTLANLEQQLNRPEDPSASPHDAAQDR